jgi:hypothetical protein
MMQHLKKLVIGTLILGVLVVNVGAHDLTPDERYSRNSESVMSLILSSALMGIGLYVASDTDGKDDYKNLLIGISTFTIGEFYFSRTIFRW